MSDNKNTLSQVEATVAIGMTNAFYTNLLRMQHQGKDTNNQDVRKACMDEVFDFYLYAQNEVKKNQA
jgi:hypothetical protein